jgi:hypothetical protein
VTLNPNWPLIDYAICWSAGPNQTPVQDYWCSVTARTQGRVSIRRGKQYELDQVQPGEMTLTLQNLDGAFDPSNMASPFAGSVLPYRLMRARAQWPPTVNLLTNDQATVGFGNYGAAATLSMLANVSAFGTSTVVVGPCPPPASGNCYNAACPVGSAYQGVTIAGWSAAPGVTYTAQCQAAAGAVAIGAYLGIVWHDVNGNTISETDGTVTALPTTGQVQLTVTSVAPSNVAGAVLVFLSGPSAPSTATAINGWNFQVEQSGSASTWVQPSPWFPLFTGYVERWPQTWTSNGNYGTVDLTVVDLFAFLANRGLSSPFEADALSYGPNFLYKLDEAQGATVFVDRTGRRGNATLAASPILVPGQSMSTQDNAVPGTPAAITGAFLGAAGPVVAAQLSVNSSGPLLIPPDANGNIGVPPTPGWTRIIAARLTGAISNGQCAWSIYSNGIGNSVFGIEVDPGGLIRAYGFVATTPINRFSQNFPIPAVGNGSTLYDSDWHLYGVSLDSSGTVLTAWNDLNSPVSSTASGSRQPPPGTADIIGAIGNYATGGLTATSNWSGQLAFAIEYPFAMTPSIWANLSNSWRNAWSTSQAMTESSDQRYQRILNWIAYSGPTRISAGLSRSYGPATDIQGGPSATAALQALQNVVDTEAGQHYVAGDGTVVFRSRADRYNNTPTVVFGENSGEVPYMTAEFDFDPTRIGNTATVNLQYGQTAFQASDTGSVTNYGVVTIQRTVNTADPLEAQAAAQYLVYQNRQPLQRLAALPVDVASTVGWGAMLGLDLGSCVTVNRRPSNAPLVSVTGFVEQVQWDLADDMSAVWTGQVSNDALHQFAQLNSGVYGRLGADSNTLNATITAGASSLAVATTAGKPTFSTAAGDYPMTVQFDAEQVTFTTAPSGSTSPQTFTGVTRSVNGTTAAAHTSGAVVSVVGSALLAY